MEEIDGCNSEPMNSPCILEAIWISRYCNSTTKIMGSMEAFGGVHTDQRDHGIVRLVLRYGM